MKRLGVWGWGLKTCALRPRCAVGAKECAPRVGEELTFIWFCSLQFVAESSRLDRVNTLGTRHHIGLFN